MKIKYLVWLGALLLASCAAIISVKGLALLFGGGIILYFIFGTMEGIKLITAGVVERFWSALPTTLRTYLIGGVGILMLITSLGIYGFFSGNYQGVADKLTVEDGKVELIENRIKVFEDRIRTNKENIEGKKEIRLGYSNENSELSNNLQFSQGITENGNQYNYLSKDQKNNQKIIENNKEKIDKLNIEIDELLETNTTLSDSIIVNKGKINEIRSNSDITAEVGPLRYLSDITGLPMGKVVNILMMLIVFVFDPMAISLVILANKLDELDTKNNTKQPKIKKGELKDTVTFENLKTETFEDEEEIVDVVLPIVQPEPINEDPIVEPEPIKEEPKEENVTNNLGHIGKKMLQKLVNPSEQKPKKQPIITKGKITQEDVPQIKEGLNRGFSVNVPERKKK